jgi:hypothetical protein
VPYAKQGRNRCGIGGITILVQGKTPSAKAEADKKTGGAADHATPPVIFYV